MSLEKENGLIQSCWLKIIEIIINLGWLGRWFSTLKRVVRESQFQEIAEEVSDEKAIQSFWYLILCQKSEEYVIREISMRLVLRVMEKWEWKSERMIKYAPYLINCQNSLFSDVNQTAKKILSCISSEDLIKKIKVFIKMVKFAKCDVRKLLEVIVCRIESGDLVKEIEFLMDCQTSEVQEIRIITYQLADRIEVSDLMSELPYLIARCKRSRNRYVKSLSALLAVKCIKHLEAQERVEYYQYLNYVMELYYARIIDMYRAGYDAKVLKKEIENSAVYVRRQKEIRDKLFSAS